MFTPPVPEVQQFIIHAIYFPRLIGFTVIFIAHLIKITLDRNFSNKVHTPHK